MKITALTASLSESSTSNRLAQRILDTATELAAETAKEAAAELAAETAPADPQVTAPLETEVINLRRLSHQLVDSMLTGVPSDALDEVYAKLRTSDAVVLAAPVYNAAPIGLLTMFLQLFPEAGLRGIPVLLASTGGTARHSLAMDHHIRPIIAYLKGLALPTTVFAATDDWGLPEEQTGMCKRIEAAVEELLELGSGRGAGGTGNSRGASTSGAHGTSRRVEPVDEFDPNTIAPFDQLLGR